MEKRGIVIKIFFEIMYLYCKLTWVLYEPYATFHVSIFIISLRHESNCCFAYSLTAGVFYCTVLVLRCGADRVKRQLLVFLP